MKGSECKFVKYMEGSDKRFVIPVYQRNYFQEKRRANKGTRDGHCRYGISRRG